MYHESGGSPAMDFEASVRLMKSSPGMNSWFAPAPVSRKGELSAVGTVRAVRPWVGPQKVGDSDHAPVNFFIAPLI
jgi:hypothetical protein